MTYRYLIVILLILVPAVSQAQNIHEYDLNVYINVEKSSIKGTSRIQTRGGRETFFNKGPLQIQEIKVDGEEAEFNENNNIMKISHPEGGVIEIIFEGLFRDYDHTDGRYATSENIISKKGVSLTDVWYPVADGLSHYHLRAMLPKGYEAVAEAEVIKKNVKGGSVEFVFDFPHPLDRINLVASDRFRQKRDRYGDIDIYAYFFKEDLDLAATYLEFTKKYLEMYEGLIGEYPYSRFSVVENFLPSGYSMPTYTLLGSSVIKLPFIVDTALGHEILHQWFGNHVYVDYQSGNWSEGLTAYLSDHMYEEQKVKGWKYRKQILVDYKSYVNPEDESTLRDFTSRVDFATKTIGYGKAAMVFHMLKNLLGEEVFFNSLRAFVRDNRFSSASWDDLEKSFEKKYGDDLRWFFDQWVNGSGLPEIEFNDFNVKEEGDQYELSFSANQREKIYNLNVPVSVYLHDGAVRKLFKIRKKRETFHVLLPARPRRLVIDESYDVARMIGDDEFPPVIARLIGNDPLTLVLPREDTEKYEKVIERFRKKEVSIKTSKEVELSELKSGSFIALGFDNPLIGSLYGSLSRSDAGFVVTVRQNPWNHEEVVGIMDGLDTDEIDSAFRKIFHYGKYSELKFDGGDNTEKRIEPTQRGIVIEMDKEIVAVDISKIQALSDVIKGVADKKIVYVGEIHDVFSHHAVQLDIIRGIYSKDRKLAIGMEMFQRPFQTVLDTFIAGKMGERDFLKQSEYFKRWGFDYNLYKPILDFARTEKIPVIALNMEREIIKEVSVSGIDSLVDEQRKAVLPEMDFSDNEYRERLMKIYELHEKKEDGNFDFFYQSQILWDETMSQSIDEFLDINPDYQIAVLAGQGHLRYGSGIPKRTERRNGHDYAIVLIDEDVDEGIADYVVFPKPVEGITAPKIMTYLRKEKDGFAIADFPEQSVSEAAGLKIGDVITFIDDVKAETIEDSISFIKRRVIWSG
jgi:uncharacterized iron-regulated protein